MASTSLNVIHVTSEVPSKRSQHAMSAAVGATGGSEESEEFVQRIRDLSAKQKSLQSADGSIRAQAFDRIAKDLSPNSGMTRLKSV